MPTKVPKDIEAANALVSLRSMRKEEEDDIIKNQEQLLKTCKLQQLSSKLFIEKLFDVLTRSDTTIAISWRLHGKSFYIRDHTRFTKEVLPKYFGISDISDFHYQLKQRGFSQINEGKSIKSFYHVLFQRDNRQLCWNMIYKCGIEYKTRFPNRSNNPSLSLKCDEKDFEIFLSKSSTTSDESTQKIIEAALEVLQKSV